MSTKPWQSDEKTGEGKSLPVAGAKPFTDYAPRAFGCVTAALIDTTIDVPTAWKFTVASDASKAPHTLDFAVAPMHIETVSGPANLQVCVSDPKLITAEAPATPAASGQPAAPATAFVFDASKATLKIDPTNVAINASTPSGGTISVNKVPLSGMDQAALIADIQNKTTAAAPYAYDVLGKQVDAKNRDGDNGYVSLVNSALQKAFVASMQQEAKENNQTFDPDKAPILKIQGTLPTMDAAYLATLKDGKLPDITSTAVVDSAHAVVTRLTLSQPKGSDQ